MILLALSVPANQPPKFKMSRLATAYRKERKKIYVNNKGNAADIRFLKKYLLVF